MINLSAEIIDSVNIENDKNRMIRSVIGLKLKLNEIFL